MPYLYIEDNLEQYTSADVERLIASLPAQRRATALKFKFEQGRKESALAYLLLCKGLREHYGITAMPDFSIGEHGKPALRDYPHIHFNLSHCKKAVLCVLSDAPVGADVECLGRYNEGVARYCMNEEEMQIISQHPDPGVPFTRLWTQKEAVLKLEGTGITDEIKTVLQHTGGIHLETIEVKEKGYIYSIAYCSK